MTTISAHACSYYTFQKIFYFIFCSELTLSGFSGPSPQGCGDAVKAIIFTYHFQKFGLATRYFLLNKILAEINFNKRWQNKIIFVLLVQKSPP